MSFRRMTAAAATGALLLSSPAFAQDSATVDVEATLVESPATFSISGLSPLSFGQISLPRYDGIRDARCNYSVAIVQGDGTASLLQFDHFDGSLVPNGTVDSNGCYAVGDAQPAHFQFVCDSVDVVFSFSTLNAFSAPQWSADLSPGNIAPDPRPYYAIARDGITVTTSGDVSAVGDPWGLNCISQGAGVYDLYAGARLQIAAIADTSTATLGPQTLGTITVDAIY